jgi:type IV pilus assembly protein PilQ
MPLRPHDPLRLAARRAVALAVCSSLVAGCLPAAAFAQSAPSKADGSTLSPSAASEGLDPSAAAALAALRAGNSGAASAAPASAAAPADALAPSTLNRANTTEQDGQQTIDFSFAGGIPQPKVFELVAPRRLVLDFAGSQLDTQLAHSPLALSGLGAQSVQFATGSGKTRVVVLLRDDAQWSQSVVGHDFLLRLRARPSIANEGPATPVPAPLPAGTASLPVTAGADGSIPLSEAARRGGFTNDVVALDYKKGANPGSGRLVIDFSQTNPKVDVKEVKGGLRVDLLGAASAPWLLRQYDLSETMTPASRMDIQQLPDRTRLFLRAPGDWAQSSFLLNRRLIVDVTPVFDTTVSGGSASAPQYKGQKVTLNFQDTDVRKLLAVLSDFSGFNIVASDTVAGSITLNLKDVPWDQALDVILRAKNLDKRQQGNVIWVAPAQEIRQKENDDAKFANDQAATESLVTESFQVNYQKAEAIRDLLTDPKQPILTKRGSAVFDARTNQLFVQDIPSKIEAARSLIKKVDIPIRQVEIEAQIVEANDSFSKNLGAKFGVNGSGGVGNGNKATVGGNLENTSYYSGQNPNTPTFDQSLGVNLPATTTTGANAGVFSLVLSNASATRFLNLELSALVSDGQGQVLSNPRVVTADQQEAEIAQGTEIPYQQASSAGNTNVAFKDANLSLKVKPQITPDGNVIMDLDVHKDTVGQNTTNGPAIDTKSIKTQVLVESGGTVIIGGIYVQTESLSTDKVPFLGDLPYIGALFRDKNNTRTRTELLIMITPKVLSSTVGGGDATDNGDGLTDANQQPVRPHLISPDTLRLEAQGKAPPSILPEFGAKQGKSLQLPDQDSHTVE